MPIKLHNHVQTHLDEYSGEFITTTGKPSVRDRLFGLKMYGKSVQNGTPTPENPVPIQNVPSSFDITSCGKNLFSLNNLYAGFIDPYGNLSPLTNNITTQYIRVFPSATYTLSAGATVLFFTIGYYDKNKIFISRHKPANVSQTTAVIPANCQFVRLHVEVGGISPANASIYSLQFKNAAISSYEPYKGNNINLIIKDTENNLHELSKISNYFDYIDTVSGRIIKNIKRIELSANANEVWTDGGSINIINQRYYLNTPGAINTTDALPNGRCMCTRLPEVYAGTTEIFNQDIQGCNISNGKYFQFKINKSYLPAIDWDNATSSQKIAAFREWLLNNPMTVYYVLETPQTHDLHPDELAKLKQIKSVYPLTNIFTSANIQPSLSLSIRKLGNRPFVEHLLTDEGGNFLVDENGNNITGVT